MRCLLSLGLAFALSLPLIARADDVPDIDNIHFSWASSLAQQELPLSMVAQLMAGVELGLMDDAAGRAEFFLARQQARLGLWLEAGQTYQRIAGATDGHLRDRAWLALARIRLQQGQYSQAMAMLKRMSRVPGGAMLQEYKLIQAYAYLASGDVKKAVKALPRISDDSLWAMYRYFNIGVELLEVHRSKHGALVLHHLSKLDSAKGAEREAIRDQASLALGFSLLKLNKPAKARLYFDKVRLDGHLSGIALLGMGWAYAQSGDYEKALVYWLELQQRASNSAYSYESLLAVPYAYNKAGAYRQSIEEYKASQQRIDEEMAKLARARQSIAGGSLVALVSQAPAGEYDWFQYLDAPASMEARVMPLLMANPAFQQTLMEYRQLLQLAQHVKQLNSSLVSLDQLPAQYRQGPEVAALTRRYELLNQQLRLALAANQQQLQQQALDTLSRYEAQLETYIEQASFGLAQAIESAVIDGRGMR